MTHGSPRSLFALAALPLVLAGASLRHNRLVKSEPAVDGIVTTSPAAIRLWFKEAPEISVSSIALLKVTGADSTAQQLAPASATDDPTSIAARVPGRLGGGQYVVRWRTAGRDGHVIRGQFGFTVR